jgi:cysteine desulfurase
MVERMSKLIYLDNAATTKPDEKVVSTMAAAAAHGYGNASSLHQLGVWAAKELEKARMIIARRIHADPQEIVFTSGGTEANNWVLKGLYFACAGKKIHIITSMIEHTSILEPLQWLEQLGVSVTYIGVDDQGMVDLDALQDAFRPETTLVTIMHANNEIGTIQPIATIGALCQARGVMFHTDACQGFMKEDIDVHQQQLHLMSLNAHKIHGPKGVGALFLKRSIPLIPLFHGGGHEQGLRSGTYNGPAIAGFGVAVAEASDGIVQRMKVLRDDFIRQIRQRIPDVSFNGSLSRRICNNINLRVPFLEGKALCHELEKRHILISTGSACAANKLTPSHVLRALGCSDEEALASVRITISKYTTQQDIDDTVNAIEEIVKEYHGRA